MKKIISICAIIIVAAIVVTVFTACGSGKNDKATTTAAATTTDIYAQNNTDVVIGELTIEVREDKGIVYNNGSEFRTLIYPKGKNTPFNLEYAKEHYDLIDLNFDGNIDAYIAVADDNGVIYYYCWLYNATTTQFDYNPHLSSYNNISVDSEEQVIYAVGYNAEGRKVISKYMWENGIPVFVESFGIDEDIPENIEQSANNNTIGDKPNSGKPVVGTTEPSGTTGETKPLLTTEPNSGGGIVLVDPTEEVWY